MAAASSRECRGAKSAVPVTPPVRPLWGEEATGRRVSVGHVPHALMYLSLKMDVTTPHKEVQLEEEILYQYPASEASAGLKGARGIYLTLCDMLENVTGGQIVSSTLLLDKHLVHVGYWKEGDALLVVGLPAERVPLLCLQSLVADAVRTLRVMHGSLDRAFRPTEHAPELDRFFCLFFQDLIQPSHLGDTHLATPPEISGSRLLNRLPAVRWLTLPAKVKTDLDSVLSDFEASDFGEMSEDFFGIRRLYGILGSCLFFKSYLIANHLPKEDLLDICVYMQHYYLLPAVSQQRVGQLVIWREVFPLGHPRGRHFLLIVGLRSWMQCVLLEVRGCTANSFAPPGPDCVYVDQVKATLLRLEIMEETIEKHLSGPAAPPPFCADSLLQGGSPQARLDGLAQGSSFLGEKGRDSGVEGNMDTNPVVQWRKPSNPSYLGTLMKTLSRRDADEMSRRREHRVPLRAGGNSPGNLHRVRANRGGSARRITSPVAHPQLLPLLPVHSSGTERQHAGARPASARDSSGFGPSQRAWSPVPVCTRKLGGPAETCSHPDILGRRAIGAATRSPRAVRVFSQLGTSASCGDGLQAVLWSGHLIQIL
ncbi:protein inturned isoform X2 [Syngnathoides biaculeatus]|uniref:protein inturned isoform X2 n=1 Tax=Syngnathoides biaculeatus TaxID=300417 RepID=UPI002ADE7F26|nr:protein inturned isoform X2 [Syngnathoides biaculeatus]